jgi:hypothetical protein
MISVLRAIFRSIRRIGIVAVSAFYVARILGSILWLVGSLPLAQRAAEWRFRRRLRRGGLDSDAAAALTEEYANGISLFGHRSRGEACE